MFKLCWVFFSRELLDIYSACKDSSEVVEAQNKWMEKLEKEQLAVDGEHFLINIFMSFLSVICLEFSGWQ